MKEIKIGENRLIPKGTKFWSIKNQTSILLDEDTVRTKWDVVETPIFTKDRNIILNLMKNV